MLILFRSIVLYYCVTTAICTEKATEKPMQISHSSQSHKGALSAGAVASYSPGAVYVPSVVVPNQQPQETGSEGCNGDELVCLSTNTQDRLSLDAIKSLHRQLDDDADGNVDLSESDEFLREDLKYQDGYQRRQQAFHRNDDKHISVRELWDAWLRSEVHNWTVEQTVEWLTTNVELPQYASNFIENRVTGASLPRLAVGNFQYLSTVLGIKDPIHKQKIALKAMDVVLFGPPKDYYHPTKDIILVTLLLGALIGCWWAYRQNKLSRRHLTRMVKDMESLQRAELALEDLQRELEHAKKEQENVATEKLNLEKKLMEQEEDDERTKVSYSDLEINQLKQEVEMLRKELKRAEGELQSRCWAPPIGLQNWLQLTHEIENKGYMKKRLVAEKQLLQAREACEKLKKKRSSLVGAFVSTHGKSIDEVDRSIVEARTSLNEVTTELQERVYRWKQIEMLCGFNIINNNGLPYLESILYRNAPNGRGPKGLGRINSNQDDLDEESASVYSHSAGNLDSWKEESSGSEHGRSEVENEGQQDAKNHSGKVQFTLGGDSLEDDISPIPVLPKKSFKSPMSRSQSHDISITSPTSDREKEKERSLSAQTKLSQSDSILDGSGVGLPKVSQTKKTSKDASSPDSEEAKPMRKLDESLRKNSDGKIRKAMAKDQPEEVPKLLYIKNYKDKDKVINEEKVCSYRSPRETPDDSRKKSDPQQDLSNFRRTTSDDFRRLMMREIPNGAKKMGGGEEGGRKNSLEDCRKMMEKFRLEEFIRSNSSVTDEKEENHSTDSNSTTTAEESIETKKKKLKLFGNFRKNKSKLS